MRHLRRRAVLAKLLLLLGTLLSSGTAQTYGGQASRDGISASTVGGGAGGWLRRLLGAPALAGGEAAGGQEAAVNITATYKGDWSKLAWPEQDLSPGVLQQSSGVAVLKLRLLGVTESGVSSVEGELVLRDGQYVNVGSDVLMTLQGVHVSEAHRLMAVLEPVQPIRMQAGGARPLPAGTGPSAAVATAADSTLGQISDDHELLREAARQVALLAARKQADGAQLSQLPDPSDGFQEALRWRQCKFSLALDMAVVGQQQQQHEQQGLAAAGASNAAGSDGLGRRLRTSDSRGGGGGSGAAASALRRRMMPGGWGQQQQQQEAAAMGVGSGSGGQLDLVLNGTLYSRNCGVQLVINLGSAHIEEYYDKVLNYAFMITLAALLHVVLLVRQMEACSTPALASRVSLLGLAHQAVLDAYLCLVHLTLSLMVEGLFRSLSTVAFMEFVVFAVFEMRFMLSAWRARRGSVDSWTAQREISVLYARFYAALLAGILLTYQMQRYMPVLMFGFFSFWWPQILLCARADCRQPLKPEFVLGTSAARLVLPLYLFACPSNLLRVAPSPWTCVALVAYVGLQCVLLLAQHWRGPRCFVPKQLLPRRYDYSRPVPPPPGSSSGSGSGDIETGDAARECVICMQPVNISDKTQRATTPCNHVFHLACLERWFMVKHDCPTCRRPLPPL